MVLILLSWLYIFFSSFSFGVAFSKLLKIKQFDFVTTSILGLFSVTIMASVWAFFDSISIAFHVILLVLSILFWYNNNRTFNLVLNNVWSEIKSYSSPIKILLLISSILILAQSATLPFIIDNESYYIQTIKWLNEYGFVKGLANLHLFFGQTSGWHIAQSVYSFSFLYDRFNDLNGFCLLLMNLFAFQKLNAYLTKGNWFDLLFGLLPLVYVFLFQFVSSPSPDFAVYILGFIVFSMYLQTDSDAKDNFIIISIFALFAFYVKITAVVLLLLPLFLFIKRFKVLKEKFLMVFSIGCLILMLFVAKNYTLSGYPLFPLLNLRMDELDYTVPTIIMDFFFSKSMLNSFYIDNALYADASITELLKHYFLMNGIGGYIGIVSVMTLFISPFAIIIKRLPRSVWGIYFAFSALTVLLFFSSAQYRFYVYFTLFFLLLLASMWINNSKRILPFYSLSFVAVAVLMLIPTSFSSLTSNALLAQNSTFHLKNIIIPEPNTKWKQEFIGSSVGNVIYQTPVDDSFFWVTGNGKLPCVNEKQIEYFEHGFLYIPQQRSRQLKDGFYSQKISGHE